MRIFIIGMILYRLRNKIKLPQLGYIPLSLILVLSMAMPVMPKIANLPLNGLYECFLVMVIFPLIIASGAHSNIGGFTLKICNLGGRISYPLYITHFTFLYMYLNLATNIKAPMQTLIYTGVFAFFFVLAFAWLCAKYYDEPIRKKLKQMLLK